MALNMWVPIVKFKYDDRKNRYSDTFLMLHHQYPEEVINEDHQAKNIIYCFWTGDNDMSPERKDCLASMKENMETRIELITPRNIDLYIKNDYPLHDAYPYLSLVHKADYLRCYFMHHHGGGYADIKYHNASWNQLFDDLNNQDKWMMGYQEIGKRGVAPVTGALGEDLKQYWRLLVGNCAYICKPYTPFTYDWYTELHQRLDGYYSVLKKYPGNIMGDNPGYPIAWTNILGDIFHPLCLKYNNKILYSNQIKPFLKKKYR